MNAVLDHQILGDCHGLLIVEFQRNAMANLHGRVSHRFNLREIYKSQTAAHGIRRR